MAQHTQQDQIDQLLLQAADHAYTSIALPFTAGAPSDDKMKEKLIHVVVSGRSRRYLGKPFTTKEIEALDPEQVQKFYARYKAVLGGLITKQLKRHMCFAYSRAVQWVCPSVHCQVHDITGLANSLNKGPFIDLALSSLTCKLYHEYRHLLAPLKAAIITSSHVSRTSSAADQACDQTRDQARSQAQDELQAKDEDSC